MWKFKSFRVHCCESSAHSRWLQARGNIILICSNFSRHKLLPIYGWVIKNLPTILWHHCTELQEQLNIFDAKGDVLLSAQNISLNQFVISHCPLHCLCAVLILLNSEISKRITVAACMLCYMSISTYNGSIFSYCSHSQISMHGSGCYFNHGF